MRFYFVFLLCLIFSESGLSQNAGGMISRKKSEHNEKSIDSTKSTYHRDIKTKSQSNIVKQNNGKVKEATTPECDYVSSFSEGLACVERNGKYGFIDMAGKEGIPCKYSVAGHFREGLARESSGQILDLFVTRYYEE